MQKSYEELESIKNKEGVVTADLEQKDLKLISMSNQKLQ